MTEPDDHREAADEVFAQLVSRIGEQNPQPRLDATRRALELLGDPHRTYPAIHITGTNGKTSTSRITESLLRAHGLGTGLMTSPHLQRVNERIVIRGEPISDEALVRNWADVSPILELTDAELTAAGQLPLTYFEALTVLAYAAFADAPVDVAVVEVGMGGEWDSTNVIDGEVAVFTPIDLDHTDRLGRTVEEIARTKSGIIKPAARVVSARQQPKAAAVLADATEHNEGTLVVEGEQFEVLRTSVAVGGQLIDVRGIAGTYREQFLPLYGDYQAQNAATAIASVESFIGGGTIPLTEDVLSEGLALATSPGRLQLIGTEPTVLVDAAHNPHGARALATALTEYFDFTELAVVLAVLGDKDAEGIIHALAPVAARIHVTRSSSERARDVGALTELVLAGVDAVPDGADTLVEGFDDADDAMLAARAWAADGEGRAVVITGSVTLVGDALGLADAEGWKP